MAAVKMIGQWLFPAACALCGGAAAEHELCAACRAELPYNDTACPRCALPLAVNALCGQCQVAPPPYDAAFSLLHYAAPVDQLVQRLKFSAKLNLARLLGELLAERLAQRAAPPPELIIPVPLHRARLRTRGFNQALEIARPIARRLRIPLDYRNCTRVRATAVQSTLPAKQRAKNVKGAFRVLKPIAARHVALVDDVMTTGSTLHECATALRAAGVATIEVWTCARAVKT
ncbi:MAG: ComF family protein [Pseudomonadota bacterium]